ncbi:3449_t:CDS:2, partial [Scutellospora calospora]
QAIQQNNEQILNQEIEDSVINLTSTNTKQDPHQLLSATTKSKKIKVNFDIKINKEKRKNMVENINMMIELEI